jgi:hypothetical protein
MTERISSEDKELDEIKKTMQDIKEEFNKDIEIQKKIKWK